MSTELENSERKVVVFNLEQREYAIDVDYVIAIEKMLPITRVPNVPSYVKGVVNLRGMIVPIIDLKNQFHLGNVVEDNNTRIIIVSKDNITIGLMVDKANDVLDIPTSLIGPCPDTVEQSLSEYINGVANIEKRLLIIMDMDKIITPLETRNIANG
ncbi:MAG TPA: chemotaxis protein CheW [Bacillaceae bacterium]|nr:chemotaxis protein CheW [Paenibacillus bovis]HLU21882.1 chemotaxis protein CheW [Bacillaceae bacterium]